jgi:2-methylisocitrate lyase-like PEP mutase family enzyme
MTRIFRDLHSTPGKPLILPNVWDAGGARIVESAGAKAVATTSAGVAWSKGYPDGNKMQPRLLVHLAGEIVKTVKVPVSIDFEAGYSDKPAVVVENLKPTVAAGISGINIEDGTDQPALLAKKIEAIKKMLSSEGVDVFVNARTDVYLRDLVADDKKVRETGTAIAQIAYKHVARLAENFLKEGGCGVFNEDAMQYSQLQNLFEGRE